VERHKKRRKLIESGEEGQNVVLRDRKRSTGLENCGER